MTQVQLNNAFTPSSGRDSATKARATLKKIMPKFATRIAGRIGAAALVATLMTGNTAALEEQVSISDLCGDNASPIHRAFCERVMRLTKLSFLEKLTVVAFAEKYKNDEARLNTIIDIAHACDQEKFDVNTALIFATLESNLSRDNSISPWQGRDSIAFSIRTLAKKYDGLVHKYDQLVKRAIENGTGESFTAPLRQDIIAELYLSRILGDEEAQQLIATLHSNEKSPDVTSLPDTYFENASYATKFIFGRKGQRNFASIYGRLLTHIDSTLNMQERMGYSFAVAHEGRVDTEVDRTIAKMNPPTSFNPVSDLLKNLHREFTVPTVQNSEMVAQQAHTQTRQILESPALQVPHTIIHGEITPESARNFIDHLKQGVLQAGKKAEEAGKPKPYYYVILDTSGGNVDAGFDMLKETNKLIAQGHRIRIVISKAQSMGAVYAFGVKGPRMILENAVVTTHASYYQTQNGTGCKIGDACLTSEQTKELQDTIAHFSRLTAARSCILPESVAELLFQRGDRNISVDEMMKYGLADLKVIITKGGFVHITERADEKNCNSMGIKDLLRLADPRSFINNEPQIIPHARVPVPVPAQRYVPIPKLRPALK